MQTRGAGDRNVSPDGRSFALAHPGGRIALWWVGPGVASDDVRSADSVHDLWFAAESVLRVVGGDLSAP
ncbi:hypothetical protein ACFWYW_39250 [Nonomuraea sp. NPDC059023]|uniref:hypothetical protein n=1 Tax=unclassified Nonomuraea TaxID=2593643 RepID=UPI00369DDFF2